MSLFQQQSTQRQSNNRLVEFRAGRLTQSGTTVTADPRKGLLYMHVEPTDQLLHFVWKDRGTNAIVDDWIIFPEDAEWKRVPQCTTGRVYLLKFKSSDKRWFFWMQEPKIDKDDELAERINKILTSSDPSSLAQPQPSPAVSRQSALMQSMGLTPAQITQMLGAQAARPQRSNRQRMEPAVSGSPPTAPPATAAAAAAAAAIPDTPVPETPASAPSGAAAGAPAVTQTPTASAAQQLEFLQQFASSLAAPRQREQIGLSHIITPDALNLLLSNDQVVEQLLPFLPETLPHTAAELRTTVRSPQFSQAVQAFSAALGAGNLNAVMQQFGVDPSLAGSAQGVEAFLTALQQSQNQSSGSSDASNTGSSNMDTSN
ncbi:hypothetical protein CAOG_00240 [Capsaspora owczarzaki ATCC 30864]|uniref:Uncharacterized protein n=1 Tax=Capsaspora owczarzaki (strain ATCC 30864) TaxID=595528 RepID=A0A0D2WGQ6_CAPO3|nr:hypothetical protein CAOG_00240 [Capsaspora owczarzaki ATCC 30864]KJE88610.1 hypothetical protein CAOG_000240 [Capsaspora owczarzaki ATCC 30864]|eukprot:XP_004365111.1 hypothetical protein CAOG_00240 [Capsaspora owczarzaki ATCC 30864]